MEAFYGDMPSDAFGSEDPIEVINRNSNAIATAPSPNLKFEGVSPHTPEYPDYNRSWMFSGEDLPHNVDPDKSPYQIIADVLSPWKRMIWTLFFTYVLPDMEAAFIRTQQIEQDKNFKPMLLGTMIIKVKNESNQFYYVRFVERLGSENGFRKIEIVENKQVTKGSETQHKYICNQIRSTPWFVAYAEPWETHMITTEEMLVGMKSQNGFNQANTAITTS